MHLTRQESTIKLPITRKGTRYLVRPLSHIHDSVSVACVLRDILDLADNMREVKQMLSQKLIKINGRVVTDFRDCVKLFNILEAGNKAYRLTILPTGKFSFELTTDKKRLCKVVGKKLTQNNKVQINFHDGTNFISKDKIKVNDSFYLDFSGKILSHIPFEKAKEVFVISGSYTGLQGKVHSIKDGKASLKFKDKEGTVDLNAKHLFATA